MFTLKHLKTLQHVLILFTSCSGSSYVGAFLSVLM